MVVVLVDRSNVRWVLRCSTSRPPRRSTKCNRCCLLGEKKRSGFGDNSEFIKGTSYLSNSTELEDKITVLTSNRIMTSTLQRLGFGITYFETKYFKTQEHYTIRLSSSGWIASLFK